MSTFQKTLELRMTRVKVIEVGQTTKERDKERKRGLKFMI